jgi:nitronate monooxygenase
VAASLPDERRRVLVENDERATRLIFRNLHNTARVGRNSVADEVVRILSEPGATFQQVAPLVRGIRGRELLETGNLDAGLVWAGQVQGLIHDIPTCAELVHRIVFDATAIIRGRLARLVNEFQAPK